MASSGVRAVRARRALENLLRPFRRVFQQASAGGLLLMVCTIAALVWANSPWRESYFHLWETPLSLRLGEASVTESLHHWINDGLMVVFFFMVGLEIKREIWAGELASVRRAVLPIAAALGGMITPAAIYALVNAGGPGAPGWGIPMATDIAFALGVLALLGDRIPVSLKVFLAALAIIDDIGAVLVIALFYTAKISWGALGSAAVLLGLACVANLLGVRRPGVYALLGLGVWAAFESSGVHSTVAGVLLAFTIPSRTRIDTAEFLDRGRAILDDFDRAGIEDKNVLTNAGQQSAMRRLEVISEDVQAPLQQIEHGLQPWVAFGIIPVFALANAGVDLGGVTPAVLGDAVVLGVVLGLLIGKPLGVTLFTWLAVRSGLAALPAGLSWRHVHGASWLAGIGFTMSLFIAGLAFGGTPMLEQAKIGVLGASLVAGGMGWMLLRSAKPVAMPPSPGQSP